MADRGTLVKHSIPGVRITQFRHGIEVGYHFPLGSPTTEEGFALARRLPQLAREAFAEHRKRRARMRRLHLAYRRRRR